MDFACRDQKILQSIVSALVVAVVCKDKEAETIRNTEQTNSDFTVFSLYFLSSCSFANTGWKGDEFGCLLGEFWIPDEVSTGVEPMKLVSPFSFDSTRVFNFWFIKSENWVIRHKAKKNIQILLQ